MPSTNEQQAIREQNLRILETQERAAELSRLYPPSEEQLKAEALQVELNAYAERFPMFAAARSAAIHHLVVPLAPGTTEPLIDPRNGSSDVRTLLEFWRETPDANVGAVVGRVSNLIALHVQDHEATLRLCDLAAFEVYDEDNDRRWTEYRTVGGARVSLVTPPLQPDRWTGWGKRAAMKHEIERYRATRPPEAHWLTWSYPTVESGQDAFSYRARKVGPGLTVLGEGEVIPWAGRLSNGLTIAAPLGPSPEIPTWLAATLGKNRSRRAMQAQREQWEADMRLANAHVIAQTAALRALEDEARAKAAEDRAKADAMLAEAMKDER